MGDLVGVVLVIAVSVIAAAAIVAISEMIRARPRRLAPDPAQGIAFLFRAGRLADASPAARALLTHAPSAPADPSVVAALLAPRFPALADRLRGLQPGQADSLGGLDPADRVEIACWDDCLRISVALHDRGRPVDRLRLSSLEDEVATLRAIAEDAPQLIWKADGEGRILWANRSYLALADTLAGGDAAAPVWPVEPLFAGQSAPDADGAQATARVALTLPDRRDPQWFEITQVRRGAHVVGFAVDATGAVAAEEARRTFVQTLTKTFATLKAGLAIFDRQRRLVLFNPAFLDLTGLRIDFLSQRPLVHSVLDRLRDMQMLPEPKNYASWREHLAALEAAAEQGTYCETWLLPGGQTYRVSGRPHPDGALAFLIEDISDEVSLTRRFRLEQETVQATLDLLPQALAVFSPTGTMTLSNMPYDLLWGDAAGGLRDATLPDEIDRWRGRCAPSPVWERLVALPGQTSGDSQADLLRLADGRMVVLQLSPLPGGSLMAAFRDPGPGEGRGIAPVPAGPALRETGT